MKIYLGRELREANKNSAADNRMMLDRSRVLMVNIIGSPGAGKTALLEQTLRHLSSHLTIAVIEGDLYTDADAKRLRGLCAKVIQINTEGSCHLEAGQIGELLVKENLLHTDIVFVENVGNLVCPAAFDLGEDLRVSLVSVTEGADKPCKYPLTFRDSHACIISKTDLLPYCDFDLDKVTGDLQTINSSLTVFTLSAKSGEGLAKWCRWLEAHVAKKKSALNSGLAVPSRE